MPMHFAFKKRMGWFVDPVACRCFFSFVELHWIARGFQGFVSDFLLLLFVCRICIQSVCCRRWAHSLPNGRTSHSRKASALEAAGHAVSPAWRRIKTPTRGVQVSTIKILQEHVEYVRTEDSAKGIWACLHCLAPCRMLFSHNSKCTGICIG